MIIGLGVDIIEVDRIKKAIENKKFIQRVFTEKETVYCESKKAEKAASYAVRFAAKEAVLKSFGTGLRDGKLIDIEILNDDLGCPKVYLQGFFAEMSNEKKISDIYISLSHTKENAIAQVIFWGDKK